jgi:hypothetical protein
VSEKERRSFAIKCRAHGVSAAEMKTFIDRLERYSLGDELTARLSLAYEAHLQRKHDAFARHLEWIKSQMRDFRMSTIVNESGSHLERASQHAAQAHKEFAEQTADLRVAAHIGERVRAGAKQRGDVKDKKEARDYARAHWKKFPDDSLTAVAELPQIRMIGPYAKRTLQSWIRDLKPGGTRPGRPRKR